MKYKNEKHFVTFPEAEKVFGTLVLPAEVAAMTSKDFCEWKRKGISELQQTLNKPFYDEADRIANQFNDDVTNHYDLSRFPKEVVSKMHDLAYERGHSGGYAEMFYEYPQLVELAESYLKSLTK